MLIVLTYFVFDSLALISLFYDWDC